MLIYKVLRPAEWAELEAAGATADDDHAVGVAFGHGGRMARRGGRANRVAGGG